MIKHGTTPIAGHWRDRQDAIRGPMPGLWTFDRPRFLAPIETKGPGSVQQADRGTLHVRIVR
jgi:hypothetical protein